MLEDVKLLHRSYQSNCWQDPPSSKLVTQLFNIVKVNFEFTF